jgi:IclR family pca regulon transcriptional regulator
VVDPVRLKALVAQAAATGFAWTYEAWADGINGAAAPIRDSTGRVIAAINLYGPSYRFPGEDDAAEISRNLVEAAAQVSRHLRGTGE